MPIEFRLLSMMDLRRTPGEILDRVAEKGEAFIVERSGQQMACLVPLSTLLPGIQQSRLVHEFEALGSAQEPYTTALTPDREIDLTFRHQRKRKEISITIRLPHGYPNQAPRVFAHPVADNSPHRWQDGALCIFGTMDVWNPGRHDVIHTLTLARRWLAHYDEWQRHGRWPEPETSDQLQ